MTIIKYKSGTTGYNVIDLVYPVGSQVRGINIPSLIGGTGTKEIIKDKAVGIPTAFTSSVTDTAGHDFSGSNHGTLANNDHGFFSSSTNRTSIYLEKEDAYLAMGYLVALGQSVGKVDFTVAVNGTGSQVGRALEVLNSGGHTIGILETITGDARQEVRMKYGSFDSAPHGTIYISAGSYLEVRPLMPLNIGKRTA